MQGRERGAQRHRCGQPSTHAEQQPPTKRLDRLERIGLLVRESDEHDRRVVRVRLTEQGASLIDGLLPRHIATEGAALRELTTRQREQLAHLLSIVLQTVEGIVP